MAKKNQWTPDADIDRFATEMMRLGGFNTALCRSLVQWADFPNKPGLFTAIMARNTIVEILRRIEEGDTSWEPLAKDYTDWKDKWNLEKGVWKMTGTVSKNLVARRTGQGYDVGLNRTKRMPRMQYGDKSGPHKSGSMKIEDYAAWMEMGTKYMHARPLFSLSFDAVIQRDLPKMKDAVVKSMAATVSIYGKGKTTGRKGAQNVRREDVMGAHTLGTTVENVHHQQLQEQAILVSCATGGGAEQLSSSDDERAGREIKAETKRLGSDVLLKASAEEQKKVKEGMSPELMAELKKMGYQF